LSIYERLYEFSIFGDKTLMASNFKRPTTTRGQVTVDRLIQITAQELDRVGLNRIDIDSILRKSKVSKGSLYHHFGSKDGLLAAAEAQQFMSYLKIEGDVLRTAIEKCETKVQFRSLTATVMKLSGLKDNREFRKKRLRAIAMSFNNVELAKIMKNAQRESMQSLAESLKIAQDRGWIKTDADLLALSYWLSGVFIGHVMLDITDQPDLDSRWSEVAILALESFVAED